MYVETVHEFCQRHGAPLARDRVRVEGDLFLLPNGAAIKHNPLGGDLLLEPPPDKKACLMMRKKYHAAKLAIIKTDFADLKAALTRPTYLPFQWPTARYGDGPAEGKDALLLLKALADEHDKALASIDAEYESLPEVQALRKAQAAQSEMDRQARLRAHEQISEIESIEL